MEINKALVVVLVLWYSWSKSKRKKKTLVELILHIYRFISGLGWKMKQHVSMNELRHLRRL
jgi:hypothetical protein